MARRPSGRRGGARPAPEPATAHERIIEALMRLIARRGYTEIGLAAIAEEAGVSLGDVRALYNSKFGIVVDFSRLNDKAVLEAGPAEGEGARDRLFDILMRRLDHLAPYKPALKRLTRAAMCDPMLAMALTLTVQRSSRWMLAGAGIDHGGLRGKVAVRGVVLVLGETVKTWFDDDDPGLARTMATLDKALRRGERALGLFDNVCDLARPFAGRRRRGSEPAESAG
jgi:AcrR family transcriptional regulator